MRKVSIGVAVTLSVFLTPTNARAGNATPVIVMMPPVSTSAADVVEFRYHSRVNYNFSDPRNINRHIVFNNVNLGPAAATGGQYSLQSNITSWGFRYTDSSMCVDGEPLAPPA
jgi:hypothetical protein